MKTAERERARALRETHGVSIKHIARLLGVSTSSVSRWVRDIELTEEQHEALRRQNPIYNAQLRGRQDWADVCRARRQAAQDEGRALARRGEARHAAGCMLYWAEGSRSQNVIRFTNSDPEMARFFVDFLRAYFRVPDEKVRVWCNLYADHEARQAEIEGFWLETLRLPHSCLLPSTVNSYSRYTRRKRLNALPFGTCRISVGDTRIVQSIFGAIQEYAGFQRAAWLG